MIPNILIIITSQLTHICNIGTRKSGRKKDGMSDLDFYIGYEAQQRASSYALNYPIGHGIVENWDNMEKVCRASHT